MDWPHGTGHQRALSVLRRAEKKWMDAMHVKICGITNLEDALAACDAGADALGFVFAEEAKARNRYIAPEDVLDIVEQLPPFVTTVGVCVNAGLNELARILSIVDLVQFHGEERPEDIPMNHIAIKAFRVRSGFVTEDMKQYPTRAWLLDAYDPDRRGGTGHVCDWTLAREAVALGRPVILAGGLTADNVAEAVRAVRPYGVDVSGGVEAAPGKKDPALLRQFIRNAKSALG